MKCLIFEKPCDLLTCNVKKKRCLWDDDVKSGKIKPRTEQNSVQTAKNANQSPRQQNSNQIIF